MTVQSCCSCEVKRVMSEPTPKPKRPRARSAKAALPPVHALRPKPLLHHEIQREIKAYINRHSLKAGDPLPSEGDLAQQLDASRNSVREAVKALEGLGILEVRAGAGLFVSDFSFDSILSNLPYAILFDLKQLNDLLEIRLHLEYGMIERVVELITSEQLDELREILKLMEREARAARYSPEADREFHRVLYVNLRNPILARIIDVFWDAFYQARERSSIVDPLDPVGTYQAHLAILRALEAGKIEDVRIAISEHYHGIEARVRRATSDEEVEVVQ
jgi:DNA-binding FadR family transcriptional regulator